MPAPEIALLTPQKATANTPVNGNPQKIEDKRSITSIRMPVSLMKRVKIRCLLEDRKFNSYVLGLIEKDMEKWKAPNPNALE